MNRQKLTATVLVLLGVVLVVGSAYGVITYTSDVLNSMLDFVTTNDFAKLASCGVNIPDKMLDLKSELTTIMLPALYLGLPVVLIMLSLLMFFGGYYNDILLRREGEWRIVERVEETVWSWGGTL